MNVTLLLSFLLFLSAIYNGIILSHVRKRGSLVKLADWVTAIFGILTVTVILVFHVGMIWTTFLT